MMRRSRVNFQCFCTWHRDPLVHFQQTDQTHGITL
uniref:Uncharacterized protein n=1 Tax=Arundo donax TaxID=35708 RepID=A0A0A8Z631_ARUDO